MQVGQHKGEGVFAGCDGKSRQPNPSQDGFLLTGRRKPLGVMQTELHHQADDGHPLALDPPDAEAAHFDPPGKRGGRTHQHAAMGFLEMDTVVADETCEGKRAGVRCLQQRERKT